MSGNPYQKVFTGQKLNLPAAAWNALMDVAQPIRVNGGGVGGAFSGRSPVVWVVNDSGANLDFLGVLGIDDIGIAPSDNLTEFQDRTFFSGVAPVAADHRGYFLVAAEPIPDGHIGRAFADGIFPAKVNVVSASHAWADVKDGDATQLESAAIGAAQILWAESGTGSKWAVIRLGNAGQSRIKVKVTSAAAGGGKYVGRTVFGESTAVASGNLSMPEGLTVASSDNVLLLNSAENGASTHLLAVDGSVFVDGDYVGTGTDGKMIVLSRIASPTNVHMFKPVGTQTLTGGHNLSGGIYSGRICTPITSGINVTASTYSGATIITDPGTSNAYAINLPEMGQTTHDLLSTASTATLMLVIDKGQTASDGSPIYEGILVWPGCS